MPSGLSVMRDAGGAIDDVEPARREMTIHDLLTHTSGLGSGFPAMESQGAVGTAYLDAGIRDTRTTLTSAEWTRALASLVSNPFSVKPEDRAASR